MLKEGLLDSFNHFSIAPTSEKYSLKSQAKISPSGQSSSPLEGYLYKLKQNKKLFSSSYTKKFFCVCRDELHYYESDKRSELRNSFRLLDIKSIRKIRAGRVDVFSFEIIMNSGDDRELTLRARTREDAERWIRGLHLQISCWKDARDGSLFKKPSRRQSEKYKEIMDTMVAHRHREINESTESVALSKDEAEMSILIEQMETPVTLSVEKNLYLNFVKKSDGPERRGSRGAWMVVEDSNKLLAYDDSGSSRPSTSQSDQSRLTQRSDDGMTKKGSFSKGTSTNEKGGEADIEYIHENVDDYSSLETEHLDI